MQSENGKQPSPPRTVLALRLTCMQGVCECFAGYEGEACQRASCGATKCSGRGHCITMADAYLEYTASQAVMQFPQDSWSNFHTTMCSCYTGFGGPDCSLRLCPKGDDPLTPHTGYFTISVISFAPKGTTGLFRFAFNGQTLLFPAGWTAAACSAAVSNLRTVGTAICTQSSVPSNDGTTYTYLIAFHSFPVLPFENNLFTNDGTPDLSAFACDAAQVPHGACTIFAVNQNVIYPEYEFCSRRGVCAFSTGLCKCFTDFTGAACEGFQVHLLPSSSSCFR